ncbi:MAG: exonuclease SbcCD subunit D [Candidatus Woesearchaeota archaeon]
MRFAHLADVHIGGYREEKLKDIATKAFQNALNISLKEKVDFILISGDLFNTSIPAIDNLKIVTNKFRQLKDNNIPVYLIAGSHDFSPSGKTMLDVLENAGLCKNVVKGDVIDGKLRLKFTIDPKTGAKITGLLGKRGMLERTFYESLDTSNLENEQGFKIFMFHTALTELKRKGMENMDSAPLSLLPKRFNYYAGGHVHYPLARYEESLGGFITYPGALFPNSFKELEDLGAGGFFIYDTEKKNPDFHKILIYQTYKIKIDCTHKTPEEINSVIMDEIKNKEFYDTIVLIRLFGKLRLGKVSDIDFKMITNELYDRGAYFVMKNTASVSSEEFEEIRLQSESVGEIEDKLIDEHTGQMKFDSIAWDKETEKRMILALFESLDQEKIEGERVSDFEERLVSDLGKIIDLS